MKRKSVVLISMLMIVAMLLGACTPKVEEAPVEPPAEEEPAAEEPAAEEPVAEEPAEDLVFATVVKSIAFNWFLRMETGVLEFGEDQGVQAFMEGQIGRASCRERV